MANFKPDQMDEDIRQRQNKYGTYVDLYVAFHVNHLAPQGNNKVLKTTRVEAQFSTMFSTTFNIIYQKSSFWRMSKAW